MHRRLGALLLGIVLCIVALLPTTVYAASHGRPDALNEMGAWFGDTVAPFVIIAPTSTWPCNPAVPTNSLTLAAFSCSAYVAGSLYGAADDEFVYQTPIGVGPFNAGDGTYWIMLYRDTFTAIVSWTRQPATQYLWQKATTEPAPFSGGIVAVQVTVAGGKITAVKVLHQRSTTDNFGYVFVAAHATGGSGTQTDPWTGFESSITGFGKTFFFSCGWFKWVTPVVLNQPSPTNAGLTGQFDIAGGGVGCTMLDFEPTANGTMLTIGGPSGNGLVNQQNRIHDLTVVSTNTSFVKTAFYLVDWSVSRVDHIAINVAGFTFTDTTHSSVGIYWEGRDTSELNDSFLSADIPLVIDGTSNEGTYYNFDKNAITNVYVLNSDTALTPTDPTRGFNPDILIKPRTIMTRNTFRNITAIGGTYGMYQVATSPSQSTDTSIELFTWEICRPLSNGANLHLPASWGYAIYLDYTGSTAGILNTVLSQVTLGLGNGIYLRHANMTTMVGYDFTGNGVSSGFTGPDNPIVLNVQGDVTTAAGSYPVVCLNCHAIANFPTSVPQVLLDSRMTTWNLTDTGDFQAVHDAFASPLVVYDSTFNTGTAQITGVLTIPSANIVMEAGGVTAHPTYTAGYPLGRMMIQRGVGARIVTFQIMVDITTVDGAATGSVDFSIVSPWMFSLPVTNLSIPVTIGQMTGMILAANYTQVNAYILSGQQRILLQKFNPTTGVTQQVQASEIKNGFHIEFSATYPSLTQ